jgi:hypothetical protein
MTKRKKKEAGTSPKPPASKTETQETETAPEQGELIAPGEAAPDAAYAALVERGRAAVAGMHRSLWELGDAAAEVETKWGEEKLQDFARDVGAPYKTVQAARTTAQKWPDKSKRLDFSISQQLNAQIDRHDIARRRPGITWAEARDLASRRRGKRRDPSEVDRLIGQVQRRLLGLLTALIALNEQELAEADSDARRELWDRLDAVREQIERLFTNLENISTDATAATTTTTVH